MCYTDLFHQSPLPHTLKIGTVYADSTAVLLGIHTFVRKVLGTEIAAWADNLHIATEVAASASDRLLVQIWTSMLLIISGSKRGSKMQ